MNRILVIGSSGSGKSTFARQLAQRLDLPLVSLDYHYWQPGWVPTEEPVWQARVAELVAKDRWVIEGNYASTFPLRMPRADTIIWLDPPRLLCLWGAVRRWWQHRGKETRDDMAPGCPEKIDWEFVKYIWTFPEQINPQNEAALRDYATHARIFRVTSRREAANLLETLDA